MEKMEEVQLMDRQKLLELLREKDEKLKESLARFESLAQSSSAVVFHLSGDGEFQSFTDPPKDFPCHSRPQSPPRHISRIIHPDDLSAVMDHFQKILRGETSPGEGVVCRVAGNDSKWVNARATSIVDEQGSIKYLLGLARDITEGKKAAEDLAHAQAAARKTREWMESISGEISGDLMAFYGEVKNSLDNLINQSDAMKGSASDAVNRARKACVQLGEKLGQIHLKPVGDDFMTIPSPVFMDSAVLTDMVIRKVAPLAMEKRIDLKNAICPQTRIHADLDQTKKILSDLAIIAINACPEDGECEFFTSASQSGISLRFPVGSSLSTEDMEASLAPSRELVARQNGTIEASRDQGYFRLTINLPYRRPKALLVDDDDNLLFLLRTYMDIIGADVLEAKDGRQALQLALTHNPDIVLSDYMMPLMDGMELLSALKEHQATCRTPVIIITSVAEARLRERMFALGADDLLQKPLTEREIIPRVRRFIA